jgi:hypothetical protein
MGGIQMTSRTIEKPGPGAGTPETGHYAEQQLPATFSVSDIQMRYSCGHHLREAEGELLPLCYARWMPLPSIAGVMWIWVRPLTEVYLTPHGALPKFRLISRHERVQRHAKHLAEVARNPVGEIGTQCGSLMRLSLADRASRDAIEETIAAMVAGRVFVGCDDEGPAPRCGRWGWQESNPVNEEWASFAVGVNGLSPALLPDSLEIEGPQRTVAIYWLSALIDVDHSMTAVYELQEVR